MIETMMDVKNLAEMLGASVRTVWRLVSAGVLPKPVQVGGSTRWFESDIEEFQRRLKEDRDQRR
ncbi:MAG TPA: helix-turn-helix domain-containing protein [Chthoniobacteraceae bacterium]|jgi:predicted DNA-binding transcriptional regulator AlpA|nr:helix-turn-helix domain-containing protein [Chthoniobacteraceae bacterium]